MIGKGVENKKKRGGEKKNVDKNSWHTADHRTCIKRCVVGGGTGR